MVPQSWRNENRRHIIYVDSYTNGVLKGCFFTPSNTTEQFGSLSQFLLKMRDYLDHTQSPQSYTALRQFADVYHETLDHEPPSLADTKATFELKILFRQHSSWQGILLWREENLEQSFRSVLELIALIDSALRSRKGCELL